MFRAAPYRAEQLRRRQTSTSLRILLLEEGNVCRHGLHEKLPAHAQSEPIAVVA